MTVNQSNGDRTPPCGVRLIFPWFHDVRLSMCELMFLLISILSIQLTRSWGILSLERKLWRCWRLPRYQEKLSRWTGCQSQIVLYCFNGFIFHVELMAVGSNRDLINLYRVFSKKDERLVRSDRFIHTMDLGSFEMSSGSVIDAFYWLSKAYPRCTLNLLDFTNVLVKGCWQVRTLSIW